MGIKIYLFLKIALPKVDIQIKRKEYLEHSMNLVFGITALTYTYTMTV